jgi:hypothetical protein
MSNFQVGDLVIHQNGEEIAIVKGVGYDWLAVYTIFDRDETMKCPNLWQCRRADIWRILTEETMFPATRRA